MQHNYSGEMIQINKYQEIKSWKEESGMLALNQRSLVCVGLEGKV